MYTKSSCLRVFVIKKNKKIVAQASKVATHPKF